MAIARLVSTLPCSVLGVLAVLGGGCSSEPTSTPPGGDTPVQHVCTGPCEGDLVIASRADLEAASACTQITGTVTVTAPDITDFTGLECLEEIGGDLRIDADLEPDAAVMLSTGEAARGAVRLTSMHGLTHLSRIVGELAIGGAFAVGSVPDGVPSLSGPVALASLDGLDALTAIGGLRVVGRNDPAPQQDGSAVGLVSLADLSALDGVTAFNVHIEGTKDTLTALAALPALTIQDGADVELIQVPFTSVDGPTWPVTLGSLTIGGNGSLTSIDALAVVSSVTFASIRGNIGLAQCLVDDALTRWGLPPDQGASDESGTTGNNSSCICAAGAVVSCLPCIHSYDPLTPETQCVLGRAFLPSSDQPLDLPALKYAEGLMIGATGATTALPALERVRELGFQIFDAGFTGPSALSFPALTTAGAIQVEANPLLTSVDFSALQTAGSLQFMCAGPPGAPLETPLSMLDLSSVTHLDTLNVEGCSLLPRCSLEHDLANATVTELHDAGLDAQCQCDANGDVLAGTCTP